MITREKAVKRLERAKSDLAEIENRLRLAHGLGDSNRAGGIDASFSNTLQWQAKRDSLRNQVDHWEDVIAALDGNGNLPTSPLGVTLGDFFPR